MDVFKATIVHSLDSQELEVFDPGYLGVSENGRICYLEKSPPLAKHRLHDYTGRMLIPGLVDCHTHLPQYAFAGIGDLELLPWLNRYTFPHEARFKEDDIALEESANFFRSCLAHGTTTVVAYATVHTSATSIAFQKAEKAGIRAFIGKVLMNQNAPPSLLEDTDSAMKGCEELVNRWHNRGLLQFIVSPRFAVSCDEKLLTAAGEFSRRNDLWLQTHLSENKEEIKTVGRLFPGSKITPTPTSKRAVFMRKPCLGIAYISMKPKLNRSSLSHQR